MLLVDTLQGKIIDDNELKEMYAKKQPYGEWLDSNLVHLKDIKIPNERMEEYTEEQRSRLQKGLRLYLRAVPHLYPQYGIKRSRKHWRNGRGYSIGSIFQTEQTTF